MKRILGYSLALSFVAACQSPSDTKVEKSDTKGLDGPSMDLLWETESTLITNESVLYHPQSNALFVSCINGNPLDKDTNGYIAVLDLEGNIKYPKWATGLNAPKGMCITQGRLFVSDIDRIVSFNLNNPEDQYVVEVPGSIFLNDLTPGLNGVFFSDMKTGHLYYLEGMVVHTLNEDLKGLNGLAFFNQSIYALNNGGLQKISLGGEILETISAEMSGGDGLVVIDDQTFIMSRWQGEVWLVKNGQATQLLDSKGDEIQTADIGYEPMSKTLYAPRFFFNKVSAYRLSGI